MPDAESAAPDADPLAPDADPLAPDATPGAHPDASAPVGPPTWETEFASGDGLFTRTSPGGVVTFGVANPGAPDHEVVTLKLPGMPALGSADHVGPGFATEIGTDAEVHFGVYRARVQLASCQPGEEVVNGFFTYFNDGADHNGDGIADNSEIDIEILCGTPNVAFLSAWMQYDGDGFVKWTRAINFANGDIWESPSDHEYGLEHTGNDPALALPGFPDPDEFYELGFDWHEGSLRFVAVVDGEELTLWDNHDVRYVPQLPGQWLFNVWHPNEHWFGGGGPPDYPAQDAVMRLDWARYWAD